MSIMRLSTRMAIAVAGSAMIAACGPADSPRATASPTPIAAAPVDRPVARVPSAPSTALQPMTAADIRRSVVGCLQTQGMAFPVDGGPECLRADGTYIAYSGWGNQNGHYRIHGHRIIITTGVGAYRSDVRRSLYRNGHQEIVMRDDSGPPGNAWIITPMAEEEYLKSGR